MFGIESKEFLIIMLFVLILFGPERIPEVARALGKGLGDVKDALSGIEKDVRNAVDTAAEHDVRPTAAAGSLAAVPRSGGPSSVVALPDTEAAPGNVTPGAAVLPGEAVPSGAALPAGATLTPGDQAATKLKPEAGPRPDLAG
jgi:TatA/E family protein of Tat protein translocase